MNVGSDFQKRLILSVLIGATLTNIVGTTLYLPALPQMAASFGVSIAAIQFLLTLYLISSAAGQLVLGPMSDAKGRRIVLLPALASFAAVSFVIAVSDHVVLIQALRVVQGLCGCACVVITRAVIRDINTRSGTARDMAAILLVVSLAPPISQTIGGVLAEHLSWRASFLLMGAIAGCVFVAALRWLPETVERVSGAVSAGTYIRNYRELLSSPQFLAYCLLNALLFAGLYFLYAALPPVLMQQYGLSPSIYGALTFASSLGMLCGSTISNRQAMKLGVERLLWAGSIVSALAASAMVFIAIRGDVSLLALMSSLFIWFIGYGVLLPNTIASAMSVRPDIAGSEAALLGFLQIASGALGSAVAAMVSSASQILVFMALLAFANLSIIALVHFARGRNAPEA